jgi:rhodanese-related sulfurtransferase
LATASDGYIRYAIEYGRPGTPMLPFVGKLDGQQINDITRYIRSWARTADYTAPVGDTPPTLDHLVINPSGTTPRFSLEEDRFVSVDEVAAALRKGARLVMLDARPKSDWIKSHIPGSYPAPFYDKIDPDLAKALPRDGTWIVCYCACPHAASEHLMEELRKHGFRNAVVLNEGFMVWAQRKYPATFGR